MAQFSPFSVQEGISEVFGKIIPTTVSTDNHGYSIEIEQELLGAELSSFQNMKKEAGSSPPVNQLLDKPETVTNIDTGYKYLINVACVSDEEIWTSGNDSTMKLYSINQGSLLKSNRTKSGNKPQDIAVTKSGDLVYTDYSNKTNEPFSPLGITTDSQSHILTADFNNECVHIIDQDGQFLRYIDCGLSVPCGLCIDTYDNLFVAQYGNRQVKKIKYQK
ncbi:uncharacterized protein LOC134274816 [Saccostrea cucullata]|uniref:uncharacterized protein LOC134274816 n=1 Tax=Saccostrea cuccullata TaxID=36930 RepID=UPI002ED3D0E1